MDRTTFDWVFTFLALNRKKYKTENSDVIYATLVMVSIGAPPVVNRQKLLDQNISFQNFLLTYGKSLFINRELALL